MLINNKEYRISWHGGQYAVFNKYYSDPLFQGSQEECENFLEKLSEKYERRRIDQIAKKKKTV